MKFFHDLLLKLQSRSPWLRALGGSVILLSLLVSSLRAQDRRWVDSTLSSMSVEKKVGQLFIVELVALFANTESSAYRYALEMIHKYKVGGFLLAGGDAVEIAFTTNALQKESELPLLINADLESGLGYSRSWRLNRGWTERLPHFISGGGTLFPSQMAIGATGNLDYAFEVGRITGREARAVGIHWTNSPVADVNNNPKNPIINTRSYGEKPVRVAQMVEAYVRGLQEEKVMATLKHFPGHGDTEQDTHMELPVLPFDGARLDSVELVPFNAGIAAGAKAVMSAHLALPKIDPTTRPATLSKKIITGLLREKLGFHGIVMTDAMRMQGVTDKFAPGEAAVLAVEAGVDVVLVPYDIGKAYDGVLSAVNTGRIPLSRINESVRRVLEAKSWIGLERNRGVLIGSISSIVGKPSSELLAQEISDGSVTLLRNNKSTLPLPTSSRIHVVAVTDRYNPDVGLELEYTLQSFGAPTYLFQLSNESGRERVTEVVAEAKKADVVVVAVYLSVAAWKGQHRFSKPLESFLASVEKLSKPVVTVAFGDPYVLAKLPTTDVVLTPYNGTILAERSVAKAMMGAINIRGKLPVTIPGKYKLDSGLELPTQAHRSE